MASMTQLRPANTVLDRICTPAAPRPGTPLVRAQSRSALEGNPNGSAFQACVVATPPDATPAPDPPDPAARALSAFHPRQPAPPASDGCAAPSRDAAKPAPAVTDGDATLSMEVCKNALGARSFAALRHAMLVQQECFIEQLWELHKLTRTQLRRRVLLDVDLDISEVHNVSKALFCEQHQSELRSKILDSMFTMPFLPSSVQANRAAAANTRSGNLPPAEDAPACCVGETSAVPKPCVARSTATGPSETDNTLFPRQPTTPNSPTGSQRAAVSAKAPVCKPASEGFQHAPQAAMKPELSYPSQPAQPRAHSHSAAPLHAMLSPHDACMLGAPVPQAGVLPNYVGNVGGNLGSLCNLHNVHHSQAPAPSMPGLMDPSFASMGIHGHPSAAARPPDLAVYSHLMSSIAGMDPAMLANAASDPHSRWFAQNCMVNRSSFPASSMQDPLSEHPMPVNEEAKGGCAPMPSGSMMSNSMLSSGTFPQLMASASAGGAMYHPGMTSAMNSAMGSMASDSKMALMGGPEGNKQVPEAVSAEQHMRLVEGKRKRGAQELVQGRQVRGLVTNKAGSAGDGSLSNTDESAANILMSLRQC